MGRPALFVALAWALWLVASVARAEPSAEPPDTTPRPVIVLLGEDTDPALVDALRAASANLERQGLPLQPETLPSGKIPASRAAELVAADEALGVFFFDLRPDQLRVLLLVDPRTAYVRPVPFGPGEEETAREAAWLIVESASLALVSGEAPAMEATNVDDLQPNPEPKPEPKPKPKPEPKPKPKPNPEPEAEPEPEPKPAFLRGGLALTYLGEGFAASLPWQSGASLVGVLDLGRFARIAIDYDLSVPRREPPAVAWRHQFALRAGPAFALADRLVMHALLGAGVEAQQWRSRDAEEIGWRAVGVAAFDLGLSVRVVGPLSLWIEPGLRVPMNRFAFVECAAGPTPCTGRGRRVVLDPWPVRPRVRAGLSVAFGGR